MNDIFEIWSLPWHVLQRNLAEKIDFQMTASGLREAGKPDPAMQRDGAGSWLSRALRLEDGMLGGG